MLRILSTFNFKKFPLGLVGCLVLFGMTELVLRHYAGYIRPPSDSIIFYKNSRLKQPQSYTGLFLGDSTILGVYAKKVAEQVSQDLGEPMSFYNYATPAQGMPAYYLLLRKYLKDHPAPRYVFLSFSPDAWAAPPEDHSEEDDHLAHIHRLNMMYSPYDLFSVLPLPLWLQSCELRLKEASFALRYKNRVKKLLLNPEYIKDHMVWIRHTSTRQSGTTAFGRNVPPRLAEVKGSKLYQRKLALTDENIYWLERFLELAQENRIVVILFQAPLMDVIYERLEQEGYLRDYEGMLVDLQKKHEKFFYVTPLFEAYPREKFSDVIHLNGRGNYQFSQWVGPRISQTIVQAQE